VVYVTTDNVLDLDFDEVRRTLFGLVPKHDADVVLDRDLFVGLLGTYASLYQYFSELYTFLIGEVRKSKELKNAWRTARVMDKRDCLEQLLSATKFEYEALSRKVTVLDLEGRE
jgi:hypothetical protein